MPSKPPSPPASDPANAQTKVPDTFSFRERQLCPAIGTADLAKAGGVAYDGLPAADRVVQTSADSGNDGYPKELTEGNDDSEPNDFNDNNPYASTTLGRLRDLDFPSVGVRESAGNQNDTVEMRIHFQAFVRLEIGSVWYPVSDPFSWRFHAKLKKDGQTWIDDDSVTDATNNGWN